MHVKGMTRLKLFQAEELLDKERERERGNSKRRFILKVTAPLTSYITCPWNRLNISRCIDFAEERVAKVDGETLFPNKIAISFPFWSRSSLSLNFCRTTKRRNISKQ